MSGGLFDYIQKQQAEKITDACIAGGVVAIELTFTVPHADKLIESMREKYSSGEKSSGILKVSSVIDSAVMRSSEYVAIHLPVKASIYHR